jgi:hypothetical protein
MAENGEGVDFRTEGGYMPPFGFSERTHVFDTLTRRLRNRPLVESTGERSVVRARHRRFSNAARDEARISRAKVQSRLTRGDHFLRKTAEDQMVRNTTTEQAETRARRWRLAWSYLTAEQLIAIVRFCKSADADVAEVALVN